MAIFLPGSYPQIINSQKTNSQIPKSYVTKVLMSRSLSAIKQVSLICSTPLALVRWRFLLAVPVMALNWSTIRSAGSVTRAMSKLRPGHKIGVRGPFGSAWPLELAKVKT